MRTLEQVDQSIKTLLEQSRILLCHESLEPEPAKEMIELLLICAESADRAHYVYSSKCLRAAATLIANRLESRRTVANR